MVGMRCNTRDAVSRGWLHKWLYFLHPTTSSAAAVWGRQESNASRAPLTLDPQAFGLPGAWP